ncbi:MAG: hypothetical protein M3N32_03145 [Actinomycetota bacterium]|nr:hypothetical protein [Actinomycetota bacterium]
MAPSTTSRARIWSAFPAWMTSPGVVSDPLVHARDDAPPRPVAASRPYDPPRAIGFPVTI